MGQILDESHDQKWPQAKPEEVPILQNKSHLYGKSVHNQKQDHDDHPLKGQTEAIQQIPTPHTPKECKSSVVW